MRSAEIIAIGSELLTPFRTDTNSLWLTEKLNDIGIDVKLKTVVGDDPARLEEAIRDALKRSDLVITTGGLGPTEDDITRPVSAKAIGRELVYQDEIEDRLRERFRSWGREMPEINKRQAFVIEGAQILPNPTGSAVGMFIPIGQKALILMPGPPREMQPMFVNFVFPRLSEKADGIRVKRRVIKISGMGESAVDEAVSDIYRSYQDLQTSILFNKSEVELHLTVHSEDVNYAAELLDDVAARISEKLGLSVFSLNGESMEEVVGRLLTQRGETVAVAESCTGGLIAMRLTDVPGSSAYFMQGAITYSNVAKMSVLGVSALTLEKLGAVSEETAREMAEGMRTKARTDHAISVTGIAGPDGGSEEKPVGTVYVGYSGKMGTKAIRLSLPGDRFLVRWRSSQAALDYLRRQLIRGEKEHTI